MQSELSQNFQIKPGWLNNTYYAWQPGNKDIHPTCTVWGEAVAFDKNTLPDVLKAHPNFNKKINDRILKSITLYIIYT